MFGIGSRAARYWGSACLCVLLIGISANAFAYVQVGHRNVTGCCGGAHLDGVRAYLTSAPISPADGTCDIQSVLAYSPGGSSQLETGVAKCNNFSIDTSTCGGGGNLFSWVEQDDNNTYTCHRVDSYDRNSGLRFQVQRQSAASSFFDAYIAGNLEPWSQDNINRSDTQLYAWAEINGNSHCPSSAGYTFSNLQRFEFGNGWYTEQSPGDWISPGNQSCYNLGSVDNVGTFHITQQ